MNIQRVDSLNYPTLEPKLSYIGLDSWMNFIHDVYIHPVHRFVVLENERVGRFAEALEKEDAYRLGALMESSHASLRDDYEVSCPELDALVELATDAPGFVGARMTGGGFGGCTVNLVRASHLDGFQAHVADSYERRTGRVPRLFATEAAAGASEVPASP